MKKYKILIGIVLILAYLIYIVVISFGSQEKQIKKINKLNDRTVYQFVSEYETIRNN